MRTITLGVDGATPRSARCGGHCRIELVFLPRGRWTLIGGIVQGMTTPACSSPCVFRAARYAAVEQFRDLCERAEALLTAEQPVASRWVSTPGGYVGLRGFSQKSRCLARSFPQCEHAW